MILPMKPVQQTTFGQKKGNCFSACVASILELTLDEVPWFIGSEDWFAAFTEWLKPLGYWPLMLKVGIVRKFDEIGQGYVSETWLPSGYWIAGGECSRGWHAVIFRDGDFVHDPHPSNEGLKKIEDATLLIPLDPVRLREVSHAG